MHPTIYAVVSRENLSNLSDAVGFTSTELTTQVIYAVIQALSGDIRYTIDGTTPTASTGFRLPEDSMAEIWGQGAMSDFLAINDGGLANLEVTFMGRGA